MLVGIAWEPVSKKKVVAVAVVAELKSKLKMCVHFICYHYSNNDQPGPKLNLFYLSI